MTAWILSLVYFNLSQTCLPTQKCILLAKTQTPCSLSLKLTPKVLIPENGELSAQVQHCRVQLMYPGMDTVQLDVLDIVNELSLGRHCDIEPINAAPQARHMSIQALFDFLQAVCEGVQAATDSLQLGEPSIQAIAGPPALHDLCHIVVPDYLDLSAQIAEPSL